MQNTRNRTILLAKMGLMTGIALICSLIHFPILPAAPFLEFEVLDIPVIISAFAFGPLPGAAIGIVSILLSVALGIANSVPYGPIMHIIALVAVVLVVGYFYKHHKTKKGAIIALILGGLALVIVMIPANLIVTPIFMGLPVEAIYRLILPESWLNALGVPPPATPLPFPIPPVLIPFNLIKAAINGVVVFLLYKRLSPFLHGTGKPAQQGNV